MRREFHLAVLAAAVLWVSFSAYTEIDSILDYKEDAERRAAERALREEMRNEQILSNINSTGAPVVVYDGFFYTEHALAVYSDTPDLSQVECADCEIDWNDAISSITVAPGYKAILYRDKDYKGPYIEIFRDSIEVNNLDGESASLEAEMIQGITAEPYLSSYRCEDCRYLPGGNRSYPDDAFDSWSNDASSIRIVSSDHGSCGIEKGEYPVVLYDGTLMRGRCVGLTEDEGSLRTIECDGICAPNWDNRASSVYVKEGYQVTLYRDSGFSGTSLTLSASDQNLGDNACPTCGYDAHGFSGSTWYNDASSVGVSMTS